MHFHLTDQRPRLHKHLEFLKHVPVMEFQEHQLPEKTLTTELPITGPLDRMDLDWLFGFRIYPEHILTHLPQWRVEHREMRVGDTIPIQVYMPPSHLFSVKIVFGVRITEVIDEKDRKGFSYVTLEGHPEKGISTFTVEQARDQVRFKVQVRSVPGNMLTKAVGSIFTMPYRNWCIRQALAHVRCVVGGTHLNR